MRSGNQNLTRTLFLSERYRILSFLTCDFGIARMNANPESFTAGIKRERFGASAATLRGHRVKPLLCVTSPSLVIAPKLLSQC